MDLIIILKLFCGQIFHCLREISKTAKNIELTVLPLATILLHGSHDSHFELFPERSQEILLL